MVPPGVFCFVFFFFFSSSESSSTTDQRASSCLSSLLSDCPMTCCPRTSFLLPCFSLALPASRPQKFVPGRPASLLLPPGQDAQGTSFWGTRVCWGFICESFRQRVRFKVECYTRNGQRILSIQSTAQRAQYLIFESNNFNASVPEPYIWSARRAKVSIIDYNCSLILVLVQALKHYRKGDPQYEKRRRKTIRLTTMKLNRRRISLQTRIFKWNTKVN